MANKWDSEAGKMTVDAKEQYSIMSGEKFLRNSSTLKNQPLQLSDLESEEGFNTKYQLLLSKNGLIVASNEQGLTSEVNGQAEGGQQQLIWGE